MCSQPEDLSHVLLSTPVFAPAIRSTWTGYLFISSITVSPIHPWYLVKYLPSHVAPFHFHVIILLYVCFSFKTVPSLTIGTRLHDSQEHHSPCYLGVMFHGCPLECCIPLALIGAMDSPILCSPGLSKAPGKEVLKCSMNRWHLYMWPSRCHRLATKCLGWGCNI